jgi:Flp pilus assembly protein TadG
MKRRAAPSRKSQHGAAAVELALVAIVFFMLLIGIVEAGRVLFTWNAAVEATRYGARVAVVCDLGNKAAVVASMQKIMPALTTDNVVVVYGAQEVSVSTQDLPISPLIPRPTPAPAPDSATQRTPFILTVPPFTTTLPRESMANSIEGRPNPVCI